MGFFLNRPMHSLDYSTSKQTTTTIYSDVNYTIYKELVADKRIATICSRNVAKKFPKIAESENLIIIDDNEKQKSLATVEKIISKLLEFGIDRNSFIIGIGGGIVCDLTGFVAHIYMRGVRFGLIPTTLLAMSDAAIGGKNGVNFNESKNMIGSFDNPDFVIADSNFLHTLPDEQFFSGLGEIIKYALISNSKILELLGCHSSQIINRDSKILDEIIWESVTTKVKIVEEDPNDKSVRHILNFGHTIGHSIELIENIPHGMAVVKGISAATDISVKLGFLDSFVAIQIKQLLTTFGYDISYSIGEDNIRILCNDKKKEDSDIRFVLLEDIGKPVIRKLPIKQIKELTR